MAAKGEKHISLAGTTDKIAITVKWLTTNTSFKKYEKRAFSEYLTSCIMKALTNDPDQDDLRLSTLKPRHAKVMTDMY